MLVASCAPVVVVMVALVRCSSVYVLWCAVKQAARYICPALLFASRAGQACTGPETKYENIFAKKDENVLAKNKIKNGCKNNNNLLMTA